MSLHKLCSIHTIGVQEPTIVQGESMGTEWGYPDDPNTNTRTFNGNVQQASADETDEYASRGQKITHEIYCDADPQLVTKPRLTWEGLFLHVHDVRVRFDGNGCPKLWIVVAEEVTTRKG